MAKQLDYGPAFITKSQIEPGTRTRSGLAPVAKWNECYYAQMYLGAMSLEEISAAISRSEKGDISGSYLPGVRASRDGEVITTDTFTAWLRVTDKAVRRNT